MPAVFFLINTLEGYVITPLIMGRRFTLDPALLFVGLLFWWFVWGTPGALLAVPMMVAFKIFCERVESLQPIAAFLGDDEPEVEADGRGNRRGSRGLALRPRSHVTLRSDRHAADRERPPAERANRASGTRACSARER